MATSAPTSKTRMGALIRSMVMPGWGQFYSDRKLMGWSFLGGELALGALAYLSYSSYQTSYDDVTNFNAQYRVSIDPDQIMALKAQSKQAELDVTAAKDLFKMTIYAAGGVYVANVVHAFLIGPNKDTASKKSNIDLVYHPELKQPRLRFSIALD